MDLRQKGSLDAALDLASHGETDGHSMGEIAWERFNLDYLPLDSNLTESYEWMGRNEGRATFEPAFGDNWGWHDDFMTTLRAVVVHEDAHHWKFPPADFACEMEDVCGPALPTCMHTY